MPCFYRALDATGRPATGPRKRALMSILPVDTRGDLSGQKKARPGRGGDGSRPLARDEIAPCSLRARSVLAVLAVLPLRGPRSSAQLRASLALRCARRWGLCMGEGLRRLTASGPTGSGHG